MNVINKISSPFMYKDAQSQKKTSLPLDNQQNPRNTNSAFDNTSLDAIKAMKYPYSYALVQYLEKFYNMRHGNGYVGVDGQGNVVVHIPVESPATVDKDVWGRGGKIHMECVNNRLLTEWDFLGGNLIQLRTYGTAFYIECRIRLPDNYKFTTELNKYEPQGYHFEV